MALPTLILVSDIDRVLDLLRGQHVDHSDLISSIYSVIGCLFNQFYISKRIPSAILKSYFSPYPSPIHVPNITKIQIARELDSLKIKIQEKYKGPTNKDLTVIPPIWLLPILFRILQDIFAGKKEVLEDKK